jgi:hypothetical protein
MPYRLATPQQGNFGKLAKNAAKRKDEKGFRLWKTPSLPLA